MTNDLVTADKQVIAAVIERDGKFLICQRPLHKRHGGMWEFPGGKLEPGESVLDAARRELAEELNLELVRLGQRLLTVRDPDSPFVVMFIEVEASGEPQLLEHAALKWLTAKELPQVQLAPSDRVFVEHLPALRGTPGG